MERCSPRGAPHNRTVRAGRSPKNTSDHLQIARLRWTSSRRSIGLHPSENGRCSHIIENSKIGVSRHLDSSTKTQMAKIMVQCGRPSRSSWKESVRSSFGRTIMGKAIWESPIEAWMGENSKLEMSLCSSWKGLFLSVYVDDIKLAGKKHNIDPMWKVLNKEVDLGEPTSLLDHVYLGCTQRQCEVSQDIVDNYRTMFESRISAGRLEKLPFPPNIRISSWSYDMVGHAKKCVERYFELANRTTLQSICSMHRWPSFQRRRIEICWRIVTSMLSNCSEMLILGKNWKTWYLPEILRIQNLLRVEHFCVFGSHAFVPISWMYKKQTLVSHSSTESKIISLDAGSRLDQIPALDLWDLIVLVLGNTTQNHVERGNQLFAVIRITCKCNLEECSMFWIMLTLFPQTSNFRMKKFCCMCLKTMKLWSRWL